ncbi:phosphoadenylylsulfate reductase [Lasius niger]|uniref:Phosphoadenylylsulfate reductase n=1 Tax=Lasius niger TaxID=67767 RepID=A0A0J7KGK6_LASNI|nr:phosphoadenylylsulfate reductase [Lasius niger]
MTDTNLQPTSRVALSFLKDRVTHFKIGIIANEEWVTRYINQDFHKQFRMMKSTYWVLVDTVRPYYPVKWCQRDLSLPVCVRHSSIGHSNFGHSRFWTRKKIHAVHLNTVYLDTVHLDTKMRTVNLDIVNCPPFVWTPLIAHRSFGHRQLPTVRLDTVQLDTVNCPPFVWTPSIAHRSFGHRSIGHRQLPTVRLDTV